MKAIEQLKRFKLGLLHFFDCLHPRESEDGEIRCVRQDSKGNSTTLWNVPDLKKKVLNKKKRNKKMVRGLHKELSPHRISHCIHLVHFSNLADNKVLFFLCVLCWV